MSMNLLPFHIIKHVLSFHDLHVQFHSVTHAMYLHMHHDTDGAYDDDDAHDDDDIEDTAVQRTGHHFTDPMALHRLLHGRFARDSATRTIHQLFHNFHISILEDEHLNSGANMTIIRLIIARYANVLYIYDCRLSQPLFRSLFSSSSCNTDDKVATQQVRHGSQLSSLLLDLENNDSIGNETLVASLSPLSGLEVLLIEHSGDTTREDNRPLMVSTICRLGAHLPRIHTIGLVNFNEPISVDRRQQQAALQNAVFRDGQLIEGDVPLDVPDFALLADNCPNLTHLSVANHSIPLAKNMGELFRKCPLEVLNCNFCHLEPHHFADIHYAASTLKSLTIRDNWTSNDTIDSIARLHKLTNLAMDSLEESQTASFSGILRQLPHLQKFHIGQRQFTAADCLQGIEDNRSLKQLHVLHPLNQISIASLVLNTTLRTIYLMKCPLTADEARTMVTTNTSLEELTIAYSKGGDDLFVALWENCGPKLKYLNLSGNDITDKAISAVQDSSPGSKHVIHLYLDYNDLSSGDSLSRLIFHTRLEKLSVRSNFNLNNKSIIDVVNYTRRMKYGHSPTEESEFDWMDQFSDDDDGDNSTENQNGHQLATHLRILFIDTDGGTSITPAMVRLLKECHPSLRELVAI